MPHSIRAYLAIGSNIEPLRRVPECLTMLHELPQTRLIAESSWYRTAPWGIEDQPDFINLVVALDTRMDAQELLRHTQDIEQQLERKRLVRNGPRTIDVDLLLYGEESIETPQLRVPHPGLTERDFMLLPLIEIAPEAIHPGYGCAVRELADRIRFHQILARMDPRSGAQSASG